MTSNLGCVGLGVPDVEALGELLAELVPASTATRQEDGTVLYDWRDASGARLTMTTDRAGAIDDVTPSYAGSPGAELSGLVALHHAVVSVDVVAGGDVVTRMAVEVLPPGPVPSSGRAVVTAFPVEVSVHADEAAFVESPASLLDEHAGAESRRVAAESVLSYWKDAEPVALLHGTVLASATSTVELTGQTFHAVRLRTVGMEVDLCLAAVDHPVAPEPGNVVGGLVYLVADVQRPEARRRGWLGRPAR
jgi:hypothetical protein